MSEPSREEIANLFGVPEHLLPEGPTDNATTTAEAEFQWLNESSREKLGVCLHGVPNYTVCTECDQ